MALRLTVALIVAASLASPATAGATSPTDDQYGGTAQIVRRATAKATDPTTPAGLPFTGLDVAFLAAAGAALVGAGFVLRRVRGASEDRA